MEGLVPAQLTSPSRVAGLRRTPCDVPGSTPGTREVGAAPEAAPCYARFLARHSAHKL